jgi:hypothetical protein
MHNPQATEAAAPLPVLSVGDRGRAKGSRWCEPHANFSGGSEQRNHNPKERSIEHCRDIRASAVAENATNQGQAAGFGRSLT